MKETGIIWDLDGTLLDTLEDLKDATNYALKKFGCPERSLEEIRRFVGNGARKLICRALPGTGEVPDWQDVLACFKTYYDTHCRIKTAPYPGMMQLLDILNRRGYPMAVVSNKPDSAVQILCADYFPGIFRAFAGESAGYPTKPAPDLVWKAAKALGLSPERCIYVGDSEVDIQTAKNAGMPCISVTWGFREEKFLREQGGTCFCRSVSAFQDTLKEMEAKYGQ